MPPLRFFVDRVVGDRTQRSDGAAVNADGSGRHSRAGRFIHKGHEFVREARHGAADTNAADIRTPPNSSHPTSFRDIAVHHRPPAAQLYNAFRRAVLFGKITLLVITGAIAAVVYGVAKQPGGAQLVIEWNHGSEAGYLIKQIK